MKKRIAFYIVLAVALSMALSGCGIKPSSVSPPAGAENNGFPHTYPNPVLDMPPVPH